MSGKTVRTGASVEEFLARVEPAARQADARVLIELMARVSGEQPELWGPSIIGFGRYGYRTPAGRTGETPRIAFSPRRASLVLYLGDPTGDLAPHVGRLGQHRAGRACLYVGRLAAHDPEALDALVRAAWAARLRDHPLA